MKTALKFMVASSCMLGALAAQANLVLDPGFEGGETGTLTISTTPWFNANPISASDIIDTSNPNSGSYNAVITADSAANAVLAQTLSLSTGSQYTVSFFAQGPGNAGNLAVSLNGTSVASISFTGSQASYSQYVFSSVTPASSSGILSFIWSSSSEAPTSLDIDDVSVTPVPEPTTMIAGALMLLPFAASTLKLRKKASV